MAQFALKWRFTDPRYRALPAVHLEQVKPLSSESSQRLWDLTLPLHEDLPFTPGFFRVVESVPLDNADPTAIRAVRKWLFARGVRFKSPVYLSYQPEWAIATTWKMVVKYWADFWYPGSDDLTVIDESLAWAYCFGTRARRSSATTAIVRSAVEPTAEADRGRHVGFSSFNVLAGGPGSLA
jgi:hypothetical protein